MTVDTRAAKHRFDLDGTPYYFCSAGCLEKFRADPDRYLNPSDEEPHGDIVEGTIWTCPMHPEIRRDAPGSCPICGMALEPLEPSLEEGPNPELIDMSRRSVSAGAVLRWFAGYGHVVFVGSRCRCARDFVQRPSRHRRVGRLPFRAFSCSAQDPPLTFNPCGSA